MMEKPNKYELISVAYRLRLLFRSEAEFRRAVGVSFETVVNNRESARDMEMYFSALAAEASKVTGMALEDIIEAYREASRVYLSLDWGDRSQLASRRKFCRMMFRLYAAPGRRLTNDEVFKFGIRSDDARLLREFFPEGVEEAPAVDVRIILLFAYGILRPFRENSRGRDIRDSETLEALGRLRDLIRTLRDDTPRLGALDKPLVFDELLGLIEGRTGKRENLSECTPLAMFEALGRITSACRSVARAEALRQSDGQFISLLMNGIWIDDGDNGRNRFWIFPPYSELAFCYESDGHVWRLRPYEFKFRIEEDPEALDTFIMPAPEASLRLILAPEKPVDRTMIATGLAGGAGSETTGELCRLDFIEGSLGLPAWFNWRAWERLERDDDRYGRFRALLSDLYNPASPQSLFLENTAPEIIDRQNNLVGRDGRYLYVYDWQPGRFAVREREADQFHYEVASAADLPPQSLMELEVSERHPLYAIPLDFKPTEPGNPTQERLADVLSDAENIRDVYLIHSARADCPLLAFPLYSLTIALDENLLTRSGIRKFTRRPC